MCSIGDVSGNGLLKKKKVARRNSFGYLIPKTGETRSTAAFQIEEKDPFPGVFKQRC